MQKKKKKQTAKLNKLEINMHHLRGNAIPAGPLGDFLAIFLQN